MNEFPELASITIFATLLLAKGNLCYVVHNCTLCICFVYLNYSPLHSSLVVWSKTSWKLCWVTAPWDSSRWRPLQWNMITTRAANDPSVTRAFPVIVKTDLHYLSFLSSAGLLTPGPVLVGEGGQVWVLPAGVAERGHLGPVQLPPHCPIRLQEKREHLHKVNCMFLLLTDTDWI